MLILKIKQKIFPLWSVPTPPNCRISLLGSGEAVDQGAVKFPFMHLQHNKFITSVLPESKYCSSTNILMSLCYSVTGCAVSREGVILSWALCVFLSFSLCYRIQVCSPRPYAQKPLWQFCAPLQCHQTSPGIPGIDRLHTLGSARLFLKLKPGKGKETQVVFRDHFNKEVTK